MDAARRLLWSHIDPPPAPLTVWFGPPVYKVAVALALVLTVIACATSVSAVHVARAARREVCAAKLDAWKARNPVFARAFRPGGNACADLEALVGNR